MGLASAALVSKLPRSLLSSKRAPLVNSRAVHDSSVKSTRPGAELVRALRGAESLYLYCFIKNTDLYGAQRIAYALEEDPLLYEIFNMMMYQLKNTTPTLPKPYLKILTKSNRFDQVFKPRWDENMQKYFIVRDSLAEIKWNYSTSKFNFVHTPKTLETLACLNEISQEINDQILPKDRDFHWITPISTLAKCFSEKVKNFDNGLYTGPQIDGYKDYGLLRKAITEKPMDISPEAYCVAAGMGILEGYNFQEVAILDNHWLKPFF